ncbi:MAG: hypothetical protein RL412_819 [Pseudomonadota bacterium]
MSESKKTPHRRGAGAGFWFDSSFALGFWLQAKNLENNPLRPPKAGSASPSDRRPEAAACRAIVKVWEARNIGQYDHAQWVFVNVSSVRRPFPDNIVRCLKTR